MKGKLPFVFQELWASCFGIRISLRISNTLLMLTTCSPTQFLKSIGYILSLFLLSSCSSYKSTWNCPIENGIGCSSIEYADEIAKQEIQLNSNTGSIKEVFLNEDYFDYSNFENPGVQE